MAIRRKYNLLLLATACFTLFIVIYGMIRYAPRQKTPGEKIENTPIAQNTEQEKIPAPVEEPSLQPQSPPKAAPVPEIQKIPLPQPESTPAPKQKLRTVPKASKKVAVPKGCIGSYRTPLLDKSSGRTKNISLASKKINGYVIEPGESFSFNGIVGERTIQKGYKSAKVIKNGKFVEDIGGGVCQLSTTLYNAAQKAGLQVLERHHHSKKVSYVKEGRDATVDYGNLDLKFKNTLSYPVEIRVGVKNGEVYAFIIKTQRKVPVSP